jgi:3-deoxy-7-phosphoheptulonate synthase
VLNPGGEPGRLSLIHRMGNSNISDALPRLIEAVRESGGEAMWICDPMHGNTESTSGGLKTRNFDNILGELQQAMDIHRDCGSCLGGVHFELTGDDVTECIGGACGLTESDLSTAYTTQVDPRLNAGQALEMAMLIAKKMQGR